MATDKTQLMLEAERRGLLDSKNFAMLEEARKRGLVPQSQISEPPPEVVPEKENYFVRVAKAIPEELGRWGEMGVMAAKAGEEALQYLPPELREQKPKTVEEQFERWQEGYSKLGSDARQLLTDTVQTIWKHYRHPIKSLEEEPISTGIDWTIAGGLIKNFGSMLVRRLTAKGLPEKAAKEYVKKVGEIAEKRGKITKAMAKEPIVAAPKETPAPEVVVEKPALPKGEAKPIIEPPPTAAKLEISQIGEIKPLVSIGPKPAEMVIDIEKLVPTDNPILQKFRAKAGITDWEVIHKAAGIAESQKRSEIIKFFEEKFGGPIKIGRFKQKALGIFKVKPEVIRIKYANDVRVTSHEFGHYLDKKYKLSRALKTSKEDLAEMVSELVLKGQSPALENILSRYAPDELNFLHAQAERFKRWASQPAVLKTMSQISFKPEAVTLNPVELLHSLYTDISNVYHPIWRMMKEFNIKPSPSMNPGILAESFAGAPGKARAFIQKHSFRHTDLKTSTGDGLLKIIQPISRSGRYKEFSVYLTNKHAIEVLEKGKAVGIDIDAARQAIKELEATHPDFAAFSDKVYKWNRELKRYAVDAGLISEETSHLLDKMYPNYVPFQRVYEDIFKSTGGGSKRFTDIRNPIMRMKGSEREIIDPIEGMVRNAYMIFNAAERNRIGIALADLAKIESIGKKWIEKVPIRMEVTSFELQEIKKTLKDIGLDLPDNALEEMASIYRPNYSPEKGIMSIRRNGKIENYWVNNELYKSIADLTDKEIGIITKILQTPAKLLRAGATLAPEFAIRNPMRDLISAMVFSQKKLNPYDWMRGLFHVLKRDELYELWLRSGGAHSALVSMDRVSLQKNMKQMLEQATLTGSIKNIITHPIEILRAFSETAEATTRLAEFELMLKRTGRTTDDLIAASHASRDVTLNFPIMGSKIAPVNKVIAFFNAQIRGYDKLIRVFKDKPFTSTVRALGYITTPSILLYLRNRKDSRWKSIPNWQKDLFWIVMTKNQIYRIPKPFELGIIFGTTPEKILEWIDTKDPKILDDITQAIQRGAAPGFIPTAIIPLIENFSNRSIFTDAPLVPESKKDLAPEYQAANYTSEVSKMLGDVLKYPPAKIDNLIRGYTGGLGKHALNASDWMLIHSGAVDVPPEAQKTMADYPIVKGVSVRYPSAQMQGVIDFYDAYEKAKQAKETIDMLRQSRKHIEANTFKTSHPEWRSYEMLENFRKVLSSINKQIQKTNENREMTPEQKRVKLDALYLRAENIAQRAISKLKEKQ